MSKETVALILNIIKKLSAILVMIGSVYINSKEISEDNDTPINRD